jgi:hypothetical protein
MVPVPEFTVRYWKVEHALLRLHGIAPEDVPAFHARYGQLQKGGLLGAKHQPGKGVKLEYGLDQRQRAVFAMELAQLNFQPAVILALIGEFWESKLRKIFINAGRDLAKPIQEQNPDKDTMLILGVSFVTKRGAFGVTSFNDCEFGKLNERLALGLRRDYKPAPRLIIINVTAQLAKFHEALREVHLEPDERVAEPVKTPRKPTRRKRRGGSAS